MKLQSASKKEIKRIALGTLAWDAILLVVLFFLSLEGLGSFDYKVFTGVAGDLLDAIGVDLHRCGRRFCCGSSEFHRHVSDHSESRGHRRKEADEGVHPGQLQRPAPAAGRLDRGGICGSPYPGGRRSRSPAVPQSDDFLSPGQGQTGNPQRA